MRDSRKGRCIVPNCKRFPAECISESPNLTQTIPARIFDSRTPENCRYSATFSKHQPKSPQKWPSL